MLWENSGKDIETARGLCYTKQNTMAQKVAFAQSLERRDLLNRICIPENEDILSEVLRAYEFPATLLGAVRYGQGHINDTFCVLCQPREGDVIRFTLQGLSLAAFPHPEELMENFVSITSYLREIVIARGGDPTRETLSLVRTRDGKNYYTDRSGKVWRLMPFIENTDCFQSATPALF